MHPLVRAVVVVTSLSAPACGASNVQNQPPTGHPPAADTPFAEKRTPSGGLCSDMPIVPAGAEDKREYHRRQPVQSDVKARTEAERLESLRKAACAVGADAVIEAVNEEIRGDNAQYNMVSSGTAVVWVRAAP